MIKPIILKVLIIVVAALFACAASSCSTLKINNSASWVKEDVLPEKKLRIGRISADRPGGGRSTEREIADLLPLLFLEKGYLFVDDENSVDYIVDVRATERDYYVGWEAKKSVSVEVVIWPSGHTLSGTAANGETRLRVETPLASGRTVAQGRLGLASSTNTETMLRSSVNELVKSLEKLSTGQVARVLKDDE